MSKDIYCYNNHRVFFNPSRTCDRLAATFILDKSRNLVFSVCAKCLYFLPLKNFEQEISKEEYLKYKKAELLL